MVRGSNGVAKKGSGVLESWSAGVLERRRPNTDHPFFPTLHYSTTPSLLISSLQHSELLSLPKHDHAPWTWFVRLNQSAVPPNSPLAGRVSTKKEMCTQMDCTSLHGPTALEGPDRSDDMCVGRITVTTSAKKNGGPTWPRTRDRPVMSRWLFHLSYGPYFLSYRNSSLPAPFS